VEVTDGFLQCGDNRTPSTVAEAAALLAAMNDLSAKLASISRSSGEKRRKNISKPESGSTTIPAAPTLVKDIPTIDKSDPRLAIGANTCVICGAVDSKARVTKREVKDFEGNVILELICWADYDHLLNKGWAETIGTAKCRVKRRSEYYMKEVEEVKEEVECTTGLCSICRASYDEVSGRGREIAKLEVRDIEGWDGNIIVGATIRSEDY
jgi:hypothetical protein